VSTWSPNLRPPAPQVTTCVSVGPSPAAGKPRGNPLPFMLQLEAAAARVRWPTGQPRNGYLTKSYAISKASRHCQSGGVKDLILAPLSQGHQLGFDVSMSDGSWTLLPLMKSVSGEGSTLFLHYISYQAVYSLSALFPIRPVVCLRI
jgi:hypothetical protein